MKSYPAGQEAGAPSEAVSESYVLVVKPSARRSAPAAGEWVNLEGRRREFDSKALAREWARSVSGPGAPVWVQDAPPHADGDADGYLVGGRRPGGPRREPPGDQPGLESF